MSEHPNVTLVKSLFSSKKGGNITFENYEKGGWDALFHPDLTYVGTSARGGLQVALGKQALLEMSREPGADMESFGPGEELLSCIAFGDELVSVHARSHRRIKKTGEEKSYEWVMTVRIENGVITRGVDVGERKIDDMYGELRGISPDSPVTGIFVTSGTAKKKA